MIILGMFGTGANRNRCQGPLGVKQMSYTHLMLYAHSEQDEMSTRLVKEQTVGHTWLRTGHSLLTSVLKHFPQVVKSDKCY